MLNFVCVIFLFALGLCVQIRFQDCGSSATVESLSLEPCSSEPCHVHRNGTYTGTITIVPHATSQTTTNNLTSLWVSSVGTSEMNDFPFMTLTKDACTQGLLCPLVAEKRQTYHPKFKVAWNVLVPARWIATWQLKDDNNQSIVCLEFPAMIER